ncbi:MAG: hypothetical protein ACTSPI_01435 [Candidatus Heimdallarchaeaceae archaeon]
MKKNKHSQALEWIINNPDRVCLGKPLFNAKEVNFYNQDGSLNSQPDCILFDGNILYIVEYKTSKKHKDKAIEQLQREMNFVRKIGYKGRIFPVFMYNNNRELEIIKPKSLHRNKKGKPHEII